MLTRTLMTASIVTLMTVLPVRGQTTTNGKAIVPLDEYCTTLSTLAEAVMEARQYGASLTTALDRIGRDHLTREIVLSAYEVDMRYAEASKRREIATFRDGWALKCLRRDLD